MLSELSCEELLRCVQQAKEDAWKEFIRRFHPVIAASVARIVRQCGLTESEIAEDLIQDVYVKLCDRNCRILREFRNDREDGLYAFLKVVSANIAGDRCQAAVAAKRGGGKLVPLSPENEIAAEGEFANRIARQLFLAKVEAILVRHTEGLTTVRDQSIFWLYYRQGWTAREIAAIAAFDLTTKGVESLLQRLLRQVRLELVRTSGEDSGEGSGLPNPFR